MERTLERLYAALEPLGLYRLRQNSLIDRELLAYQAGFGALEGQLAELEAMTFVQTAPAECLALHERAVGLSPREGLDDGTRRQLVLRRTGLARPDFTKEGILEAIRAVGMDAQLIEDIPGETLTVRCVDIIDKSMDLDRLTAAVAAVLPAHLETVLDIGELTWDSLERSVADWDGWDAVDFSWTDFDVGGLGIFGSEE